MARPVELLKSLARTAGAASLAACLSASIGLVLPSPMAVGQQPPKKFTPPVHARPIRNTLREPAVPRVDPQVQTISAVIQDEPASWRSRSDSPPGTAQLDDVQLHGPTQVAQNNSDPPPPPAFNRPADEDGHYGHSVLSDDLTSPRLHRQAPDSSLDDRYAMPPLRDSAHGLGTDPLDRPGQFASRSFQTVNQGDLSCDDARKYLLDNTLKDITTGTSWQMVEEVPNSNNLVWKKDTRMDITNISPDPPKAVGHMGESVPIVWKNRLGRELVKGRLVNFYANYVIVEDEQGQRHKIPFIELGDESLSDIPGALASVWLLPKECTIGSYEYEQRMWIPQTVTWTASALCHKPLFFEDINLERYGHTSGPISQPVLSTAHFFVSLAALPYQMGINPPNECQYALGYYRPGDCAPWLLHPIPISLKGALYTGLVYTGGAYILP